MSTMDKFMMKTFLRILQSGPKALTKKIKEDVIKYAGTILNNDKQKELEDLLEALFPKAENENVSAISGNKIVVYPNCNTMMVNYCCYFNLIKLAIDKIFCAFAC